jgi:hypothetical protein
LPFGLTVAPREFDRFFDGINIPAQNAGETHLAVSLVPQGWCALPTNGANAGGNCSVFKQRACSYKICASDVRSGPLDGTGQLRTIYDDHVAIGAAAVPTSALFAGALATFAVAAPFWGKGEGAAWLSTRRILEG